MDLVNAPFPEANRQPELMARLAATGYTELGFDSIMPVFLDYPRILCARVQDSMGAEGQLAHGLKCANRSGRMSMKSSSHQIF